MPTQGEQILNQLRRYEDGKREPLGVQPLDLSSSTGKSAHEDELLNSQLELLQLETSPGTMVRYSSVEEGKVEPNIKQYTSLKILASEPKYVPPLNFGVVESDLYRSGHPQAINYPFLESLHLRTIIYVGDTTNSWEYYAWIRAQRQGIQFLHVPVDTATSEGLSHVLSVVAHVGNYPVLVHSNKGKHRVGVVVALVRKVLQGWALAAVYDEYGKYAKHGKDNTELQLVEFFKGSVAVAVAAPATPEFVVL